MTNRKNTTRARFVASALAMLLCVAMLVGTTFAWFSDSASTGDTTITAGNLDVEIVDESGASLEGEKIFNDGDKDIEKFLWEPGAMWTSRPFAVKNSGSLALTYTLDYSLTKGEGKADLTQVVQMRVVEANDETLSALKPTPENDTYAARKAYWEAIESTPETVATSGIILPETKPEGATAPEGNVYSDGQTPLLLAVLYWEPSESTSLNTEDNPDNLYNSKDETLSATFALSVFATQTPYESDSFGKEYDAPAKDAIPTPVGSAQELENAFADPDVGYIELTEDIDLDDAGSGASEYGAERFKLRPGMVIDGGGKEIISHYSQKNGTENGVFWLKQIGDGTEPTEPAVIKNVTIKHTDEANYSGAGIVLSKGRSVILENVKILGDFKIGLVLEAGTQATATDCTIEGRTGVKMNDIPENKVVFNNVTINATYTATNEDVSWDESFPDESGYDPSYGTFLVNSPTSLTDGAISLTGCHLNSTFDPGRFHKAPYSILLNGTDIENNPETIKALETRIFGVSSIADLLSANEIKINGTPATEENVFLAYSPFWNR